MISLIRMVWVCVLILSDSALTCCRFKYDVICPSQWVNSDSDEEDEEEVDYFILSKPLKH